MSRSQTLPLESGFSVAQFQSHVFIEADDLRAPRSPVLGHLLRVALRARVDLVELADPLHGEVGLGMIGSSFLEFPGRRFTAS